MQLLFDPVVNQSSKPSRDRIVIRLLIVIQDQIVIRLFIVIRDRIVTRLFIVIRDRIVIRLLIVFRQLIVIRDQTSDSSSDGNWRSNNSLACANNLRSNSNSTSNSNSNSRSKLWSWKRRSYLFEKQMAQMGFCILSMLEQSPFFHEIYNVKNFKI